MGALLDQTALSDRMPDPSVLDDFPEEYVAALLADTDEAVVSYLGWDPRLSVHEAEEGTVELAQGGPYVGSYLLELDHLPLVAGPPETAILALALSYPVVYLPSIACDPRRLLLAHATAQVWVPLAVVGGAYFGGARQATAIGYVASYVAGYATGSGDPRPDGGGSGLSCHAVLDPVAGGQVGSIAVDAGGSGYLTPPVLLFSGGGGVGAAARCLLSGGAVSQILLTSAGSGYTSPPAVAPSSAAAFAAAPLPAPIRAAAALLAREALALDNANAPPVVGGAGGVRLLRTATEEVAYGPASTKQVSVLGYGTPLSDAAVRLLARYKRAKRRIVSLI